MSYPLTQQIEAVKLVVAEKRGAGEEALAAVLQAALATLIATATEAGTVVPVSAVSEELQASVTLYKQFEKVYREWCKEEFQLEARIDGGDGLALRNIINYLRNHCTAKTDEGALASWKYVLANWKKAPQFVQRQTSLKAINKYLIEIMRAIRQANQPVARAWPDVWSAAYEGKLKPEELTAYRAHLRGRGWRYSSQRQTWIAPE